MVLLSRLFVQLLLKENYDHLKVDCRCFCIKKAQTVVVAHTDHCVAPESVHELGLHHALSYVVGVTQFVCLKEQQSASAMLLHPQ